MSSKISTWKLPSPAWPTIGAISPLAKISASVSATHSANREIGTHTSVDIPLAPGRSVSVKDLLWQGDLVPVSVMVSRRPSTQRTGVPYIASFAEVEVAPETGRPQVLQIVVINDCGAVMYASGAEAQQVGGQVMALGEALTEELIYDPVRGVPLNFNLIDYKMPTILDMPDVEPVLLEVWRGAGEYGACGIGEGTLTCTPRAVANAIYNAIGVRVDELPLTPDKVLRALGKI